MKRVGGQWALSPTDLTKHVACAHITTLDVAVARSMLQAPRTMDELDLIVATGSAHEGRYLEWLRAAGRTIVDIPRMTDVFAGRAAAEQLTLEAMRAGAEVIYQATLVDGVWGGRADFLLRVETPSNLGSWSYEVADTGLARQLRVPALMQMALYAERLGQLQGAEPRQLHVITGDGENQPWRLLDVAAYASRIRSRLSGFLDDGPETEPVPVTHCQQCRWQAHCMAGWQRDDDLSLVAFMSRDHREALRAQGISTLGALANSDPAELPRSIGQSSRTRLVQQAAEQQRERSTGQPSYLLLPPAHRTGLLRLPQPNPGDLYLDFEGDPYADGGAGREYLAGLGDRSGAFTALWAHSAHEERQLTVDLLDLLTARWREHPAMHVYHYAPYETAALKRLTAKHGVREFELDQLLRAEVFVDLYAVVRQGLRISKPSYSIKKLEAFYWASERSEKVDTERSEKVDTARGGKVGRERSGEGGRERGGEVDTARSRNGGVADAIGSVVAYERWLVHRDATTLAQIEDYNHDDVRSTHDLHHWLEGRRNELFAMHGQLPRPEQLDVEPDQRKSDIEVAEADLAQRLQAAGHQLLGDLVQWHRREARPAWWEFFRLDDLQDDEFVDDASALGPLSAPIQIGSHKRSLLWRYTFEPQDTRVRAQKPVFDVMDHESAGTVVELDAVGGFVIVKRGAKEPPKSSRAFGPPGPIGDEPLRESIASAGEALLEGRSTLAHALLARQVPGTLREPDESAADAVVRIGRGLAGNVLAVQGPPGSGKTTVGARLIRALLDDGKTVGVTATSHSVIGHLLSAVGRPALHKCDADQHNGSSLITRAASNTAVLDAVVSGRVKLVGGTAWLWARSEMASAVDVLVVDEAGQFSLANAVAVAGGARSMVLLGDPQQLTQPSQAVHPDGAGASALEHLLDGHDTVPADRGVFLDTSWRMHPAITSFISELAYDERLSSAPGRERQEVLAGGRVWGSGIRVLEVAHVGKAAKSPEEARAIHDLWHSLQGVGHVDADGSSRPIGPQDIVIVAPYNNQVAEIRRLLPAARVGTVDKFQGQEASVVVYSMTSSTAEDAPRGIDFLYDTHRLNVAVSRARALAVVVLNPGLLDAAVRTPEQLRRVNALCRLVEVARKQDAPTRRR